MRVRVWAGIFFVLGNSRLQAKTEVEWATCEDKAHFHAGLVKTKRCALYAGFKLSLDYKFPEIQDMKHERSAFTIIGVISDTHGLLRPEATAALQGVDHILHAGDVGGPEIIDALARIAPVTAVRGNVDTGPWARALPETEVVELGGVMIYMLHDLGRLDLKPAAAGMRAVVYGHSHQPEIEEKDGVLYFNPGSAGPRRFKLPVSLGKFVITKARVEAELVELAPTRRPRS